MAQTRLSRASECSHGMFAAKARSAFSGTMRGVTSARVLAALTRPEGAARRYVVDDGRPVTCAQRSVLGAPAPCPADVTTEAPGRYDRRWASTAGVRDTHDILVVGAGIMGLNIAYQLRLRLPEARITVLEAASGLGEGSTGSSSAILRAFYSLDPMMQYSVHGSRVYRELWQEYTQLPSSDIAGHFNPVPHLWFMHKTRDETVRDHERLAAFGIGSSVLSADDITHRWGGHVNPCNQLFNQGDTDHECGSLADEAFLCEDETGYCG